MSKPTITFTSLEIDWDSVRKQRRTNPPGSIGGGSRGMAISLDGDVQISDGKGQVLFPEPLVRRAYRVGLTEVLESANPGRGYRLYVFAMGLSMVRLRTEGFGTFSKPPDTHAYIERSSDAVIHFDRHGDNVRIGSHVPNVPDEEMPTVVFTVNELYSA